MAIFSTRSVSDAKPGGGGWQDVYGDMRTGPDEQSPPAKYYSNVLDGGNKNRILQGKGRPQRSKSRRLKGMAKAE